MYLLTAVRLTPGGSMGKYDLRHTVKKLYQLHPKVTASSVLVAPSD